MTENQISIKLSQAEIKAVHTMASTLTMKPHMILIDLDSKGGKKAGSNREIILRLIEI